MLVSFMQISPCCFLLVASQRSDKGNYPSPILNANTNLIKSQPIIFSYILKLLVNLPMSAERIKGSICFKHDILYKYFLRVHC